MQHVELTMVSMQLVNVVASLETREGCPITPGHSFAKEFLLTPLSSSNVDKRGIALDGYLKVIFSVYSYNIQETYKIFNFFFARTTT